MLASRDLDIVVYGATGFTGRLVAEYLAERYRDDGNLRWAIAGRNRDRLEEVRALIGASAEMPLVVADSNDPTSLRSLAASTGVVISTVGPIVPERAMARLRFRVPGATRLPCARMSSRSGLPASSGGPSLSASALMSRRRSSLNEKSKR